MEDIEVPITVIRSEPDDIFPEDQARRVFGRLKGGEELRCLPGKPHLVKAGRVDKVLPAISEWLKERMR